MTGDLVLDLVISFAGIAVLVLFAVVLGAWRTERLTLETAAARLAFDEPDLIPGRDSTPPGDWLIDRAGRAACALFADRGEMAVVFVLGDGLATRRLPIRRDIFNQVGAKLVIALNEPSRGRVMIDAGEPDRVRDWLQQADITG